MGQSRPCCLEFAGALISGHKQTQVPLTEMDGGCSHSSAKNKKGAPPKEATPCRRKDCAELLTFRQPQIDWVVPIILAKRALLGYLTPNPTI